jgi:hypothetical protein
LLADTSVKPAQTALCDHLVTDASVTAEPNLSFRTPRTFS